MRNFYENNHNSTRNVYTKTFHMLINMYMATTRNVEVILDFACSRRQYVNPIKTVQNEY